jgi:hypothetical protein
MQNKWIGVKDRLPESGQEVLVYWYDKPYEVHQIHMLSYFKKGDVIDNIIDYREKSPQKRLLDTLFNPNNEIKAPEDGFYIYDGNWRKHADIITHWMPLPEFPEQEV